MIGKTDVCIIGAGLSGLACADKLMNICPNITIIILEARDRIGGRTEISKILKNVDMGAQWIGPSHTEILSYVKKFNLRLCEQYYSEHSYCLTECVGFKNPSMKQNDTSQIINYISKIEQLSKSINLEKPSNHKNASEWDLLSVADHISQTSGMTSLAKKELFLFVQTVLACNPSQISFLFFLFYIKSGGGIQALGDGEFGAQKWKLIGGMHQLTNSLLNHIQTKSKQNIKICLSTIVNSVTQLKNNKIIEVISDQGLIHCNQVIFCLSPQLICKTLKIEPELTTKKIISESLVAGHVVKIFLVYADAFWLKFSNSIESADSTCHFSDLGYVHNLFHSTFEENGSEYPALIGLITGESALIFEKMTESERKLEVLNQISIMYNEPIKAMYPKHYIEKVWGLDLFSLGCFAGIMPPNGIWAKYGGDTIRTSEGSFFFGSTETATEYYGYMEGAIRAGIRAAIEVSNSLGNF